MKSSCHHRKTSAKTRSREGPRSQTCFRSQAFFTTEPAPPGCQRRALHAPWFFHSVSAHPTEGQPSGQDVSVPGSLADRPSCCNLTCATHHPWDSFCLAPCCSLDDPRNPSSLHLCSGSCRPVHLQVTSPGQDTPKPTRTNPIRSLGETEGRKREADAHPQQTAGFRHNARGDPSPGEHLLGGKAT